MDLCWRKTTERYGADIEGLDVKTATDDQLREALALLLQHRFIVFKDQRLENSDYVAFGRRWGRPVLLIARNNRLGSHPEMIVQSNAAGTHEYVRNVANHWHCDSSYEEEAATFTMLYGVEAPDDGGYTLFADTVAAYAELPEEKKREYGELRLRHAASAGTPLLDEKINDRNTIPPEIAKNVRFDPPVSHPLIAQHPVTGRCALYGLGGSCFEVEGMSSEESKAFLLDLRRYATQEKFVARHKLMPGEVMIWDNFSVLHRATPIEYTDEPGRRRLNYRISVKGAPDFAAAAP